MLRLFSYILLFFSFNLYAETEFCIQTGGYIEMNMRDKMINDLNIKSQDIDLKRTKIELLSDVEVNNILALELARKEVEKDKLRDSPTRSKYEDHYKNYKEYNPHNLIVKFTYFDEKGKANVFIASTIINDIECSVSFSSYLTVSREF
ncbi:hypothetical protein [Photorhabdus heterorhabditis]|uniref:Shiga toxin A subunit n=1 Tax=Photorhabdus heterorhabditis TaxID=880156 RepID=A0ABR5K9G1_9GAMM|nr:hypothetical protein [Photorhabdus heterorhabditis]KOY61131.1 hypothetical protein AM629_15690 [Photorhabdus heterorhabditis]MBS9441951.1 hypothetical protein [Photorhabdus heterorhabditis]